MKILVAGKNVEWARQKIQQIADNEKIDSEIYTHAGDLEEIPADTDLLVYLYDEVTVKVPSVVEAFDSRLVFPEAQISHTALSQMLRSLERSIRAKRRRQ